MREKIENNIFQNPDTGGEFGAEHEIHEKYVFLDPRQEITELMSRTTQFHNVLPHALSANVDLGIGSVISVIQEKSKKENIDSDTKEKTIEPLQQKLLQIKDIESFFNRVGEKSARDVDELTRAINRMHDIRKEASVIIGDIDKDARFGNDERIKLYIDASKKSIKNCSVLDPLRLALSDLEDEPSVNLSDRISEEMRGFTEPYLKPDYDIPGYSETRLLAAIAGIKGDKPDIKQQEFYPLYDKVCAWLDSQKHTDQTASVETLLAKRGFILNIEHSDRNISEESFSLIQDEIRRILIDEALIKNLNVDNPKQSIDAFLKITVEDTDQGPALVFRYPVNSQYAQRIVKESRKEILQGGQSRRGGAPSFRLFLIRLAYDRRKKTFRSASIEGNLDNGKQIVAEKISII